MKLERMIGARIKSLSNLLKRQVDQSMSEIGIEPLTGMQGRIVGYLGHHQDQDVFQRDIEEEFQIRRSTATGILQLLEKKGLLERRPVARDGRLKKLVLTPKALAIHQCIEERIMESENDLYSCLTPEELEQFFIITDKLRHHLEKK